MIDIKKIRNVTVLAIICGILFGSITYFGIHMFTKKNNTQVSTKLGKDINSSDIKSMSQLYKFMNLIKDDDTYDNANIKYMFNTKGKVETKKYNDLTVNRYIPWMDMSKKINKKSIDSSTAKFLNSNEIKWVNLSTIVLSNEKDGKVQTYWNGARKISKNDINFINEYKKLGNDVILTFGNIDRSLDDANLNPILIAKIYENTIKNMSVHHVNINLDKMSSNEDFAQINLDAWKILSNKLKHDKYAMTYSLTMNGKKQDGLSKDSKKLVKLYVESGIEWTNYLIKTVNFASDTAEHFIIDLNKVRKQASNYIQDLLVTKYNAKVTKDDINQTTGILTQIGINTDGKTQFGPITSNKLVDSLDSINLHDLEILTLNKDTLDDKNGKLDSVNSKFTFTKIFNDINDDQKLTTNVHIKSKATINELLKNIVVEKMNLVEK